MGFFTVGDSLFNKNNIHVQKKCYAIVTSLVAHVACYLIFNLYVQFKIPAVKKYN